MPNLAYIIFKNSVCTAMKTHHFTITNIKGLMLFKESVFALRIMKAVPPYAMKALGG
jgi:hypothetical protein